MHRGGSFINFMQSKEVVIVAVDDLVFKVGCTEIRLPFRPQTFVFDAPQ